MDNKCSTPSAVPDLETISNMRPATVASCLQDISAYLEKADLPTAAAMCRRASELLKEAKVGGRPMNHAKAFHDAVLGVVEILMTGDPAVDTLQGRALSALATALEEYEKSTLSESGASEDPLRRDFDCNYDGDWQTCDKETCHREKQCARRTAGLPQSATGDIQAQNHALLKALGDCYTMARRELSRHKSSGDPLTIERWNHVKRFCEETGLREQILRASFPTEITDGTR